MIVDALFGTGLSRAPEGKFAAWVEAVNDSRLPVIAVDVPSGLDADTGVAYAPSVRADTTVTLGLAKPGLLMADGPHHAGEVWLADIGVPFEAYAAVGVQVPRDLFAARDRVEPGHQTEMNAQVVWGPRRLDLRPRLWLDPLVVRSFAFISHAHTDHARRQGGAAHAADAGAHP